MSSTAKSGIQTTADGSSFIPASKRSDGTTRKEIRVRPGYRPPEDVETYKNRSAAAWKNRGTAGVPGAESTTKISEPEAKSKNAKRREAARKKAAFENTDELDLAAGIQQANLSDDEIVKQGPVSLDKAFVGGIAIDDGEIERQKKIRNSLKKLKAVRELKDKRTSGEKLSHDQLMKIGKETELLRDLKKLGHDGPEMVDLEGKAIPTDAESMSDHAGG